MLKSLPNPSKRKVANLPPLTQLEFDDRKELAAAEEKKKIKVKKSDKKHKNKKSVNKGVDF